MSRRRELMSDALKYEFAQELGIVSAPVYGGDYNFETAAELGIHGAGPTQSIDWGSVSSRDCGNLVKMAIIKAQNGLANNSAT